MVVSEAAAERSAELSAASDVLAAKGVEELETAQMARAVARDAVASGVAEIAQGAEEIGVGEATAAMGAALEAQAR
jgi:hypothetical protein